MDVNDVLCIYLYIFPLFYVLLFEIKMSTLPFYHCYTTIYSHYSIQLSPWLSPCHFHNNYFVFNAQVELQTFLSLPTTPLQPSPPFILGNHYLNLLAEPHAATRRKREGSQVGNNIKIGPDSWLTVNFDRNVHSCVGKYYTPYSVHRTPPSPQPQCSVSSSLLHFDCYQDWNMNIAFDFITIKIPMTK